jgi:hypothetical protein
MTGIKISPPKFRKLFSKMTLISGRKAIVLNKESEPMRRVGF